MQRPFPKNIKDNGHRYTLIQRVHCLALLSENFSLKEVEQKTGVLARTQRDIKKKAFDRGFRPEDDPRILEHYVVDSPRSGRPKRYTSKKDKERASGPNPEEAPSGAVDAKTSATEGLGSWDL